MKRKAREKINRPAMPTKKPSTPRPEKIQKPIEPPPNPSGFRQLASKPPEVFLPPPASRWNPPAFGEGLFPGYL